MFDYNIMSKWNWYMSIAQRCINMSQLRAIHAVFITNGLHHNTYAMSQLLSFCALSDAGSLPYASLLFTQIKTPNAFIYNTLIRAYSRSPHPTSAFHYFNLMLDDDTLCPNHHTFPFLLVACANASCVYSGRKIHNWVLKLGTSDCHIQTAMIRFYMNCKRVEDARKVFDEITDWDVFQCNVMMNGFLKFGSAAEALGVLQEMLNYGIDPDEFCLTTGLTACGQIGALAQGKWIHEYVKRVGMVLDVHLGTALVDMYVKCGCIDMASKIFETMPKRNVHSWASIIGGFGLTGDAKSVVHYLERMQVEDGFKPDGVILLGVLTAFNHGGLLKEGRLLLKNMEARYGVAPKHEHYSCMVDLLSRAGLLDEAFEVVRSMPMKPLASVWGALLSGCRIYNNIDLAEICVKELLLVENGNRDEEDGAYVQLSSIYFAAGKCEDASMIRRKIGDRSLKKTPGCSMIEVDGESYEFVSADVSHPQLRLMHAVLELVSFSAIPHVETDKPHSCNPVAG